MIVLPSESLQGEHPDNHHSGKERDLGQPLKPLLPSLKSYHPGSWLKCNVVENISGYERELSIVF